MTAVDYSTKMLEEVRRNLETEGLKAELHQDGCAKLRIC
ncbi:MAG: class I SAM-dependent methyltransferase [Ruminococcus sp.]